MSFIHTEIVGVIKKETFTPNIPRIIVLFNELRRAFNGGYIAGDLLELNFGGGITEYCKITWCGDSEDGSNGGVVLNVVRDYSLESVINL